MIKVDNETNVPGENRARENVGGKEESEAEARVYRTFYAMKKLHSPLSEKENPFENSEQRGNMI